jgi:hypothetical protein
VHQVGEQPRLQRSQLSLSSCIYFICCCYHTEEIIKKIYESLNLSWFLLSHVVSRFADTWTCNDFIRTIASVAYESVRRNCNVRSCLDKGSYQQILGPRNFVCFSALTEVTVIVYQCQSCARWFPGARVVYSHQQTIYTRPRKCHNFGTTCWNER